MKLRLAAVAAMFMVVGCSTSSSGGGGATTPQTPGDQPGPVGGQVQTQGACQFVLENVNLCLIYEAPAETEQTLQANCNAYKGQKVPACATGVVTTCQFKDLKLLYYGTANQKQDFQQHCTDNKGRVL